jgi:glycosyltransferase involved in cell wall biosynthesis
VPVSGRAGSRDYPDVAESEYRNLRVGFSPGGIRCISSSLYQLVGPETAPLRRRFAQRAAHKMRSSLPHILLLGPARAAVSGVSTHLNQLFGSKLGACFHLSQFQVGSEGLAGGRVGLLLRAVISPFELTARLIRDRPSIVHINTSFEPKSYWRDLAYLAIAKILRRKIVYQVHGGALPQEFFASSGVLTALLRRVLSCPDVVVLLSSREIAAYREFVPRVRLELIANAVEIEDVDLNLERYASNRPLEVVYIGRLADSKGVFDIVEAIGILRSREIDVHLRLAGSGPAEHELRKSITDAGLDDRVELLGPIFGAAKQQLWRSANVMALPSHREGLPFALLESMAAGAVPVISPVGAIPDVMQHEVHGLFVPSRNPSGLADALERLDADRGLLLRLAVAGRKRIENQYSVARLAAEFQRLYASLV